MYLLLVCIAGDGYDLVDIFSMDLLFDVGVIVYTFRGFPSFYMLLYRFCQDKINLAQSLPFD